MTYLHGFPDGLEIHGKQLRFIERNHITPWLQAHRKMNEVEIKVFQPKIPRKQNINNCELISFHE